MIAKGGSTHLEFALIKRIAIVYEIDSTVPLKTFYIYDAMHTEIFRMTKELLHALPTYRFYLYGEPYGVLKKQFALVRDQFSMELPEETSCSTMRF